MKQKIGAVLVASIVVITTIGTHFMYTPEKEGMVKAAENHVHSAACYAGTQHTHTAKSGSCYKRVVTGTEPCGGSYTGSSTVIQGVTYYQCWKCQSRVGSYGSSCAGSSNSYGYQLICGKTDSCYYNGDTEVSPICNQVVTSLVPTYTTQTLSAGETPDVTAIAYFLDGHSETVTCSYTGLNTALYNTNQTVTLSYGSYSNTASNPSASTCSISVRINGYFALSPSIENTAYGTVSGSNSSVLCGSPTSVTATVNTGYTFAGWYVGSDKVSDSLQYSFTMPAYDYSPIAKCTINNYPLVIDSENTTMGTVSNSSGSIPFNKQMNIEAVSKTGYSFVGWYNQSNLISSNAQYSFYMPASEYLLTAKFKANEYTLTLTSQDSTMGSVTTGGLITYNDTVSISATPSCAGYSFDGWYSSNNQVSKDANYSFNMPADDYELEARFKRNSFTLSLSSNNEKMGSVSSGGNILYDDNITITATPITGYKFVGWYDSDELISTDSEYKFSMPANNYNLTAKFERDYFTLVVSTNDSEMGSVTDGGSILYKETVEVTATPSCAGYSFVGWYVSDELVSEDSTYSFTMPAKKYEIKAKFKRNKFTLSLSSDNTSMGTVSEGGSVLYKQSTTVTAYPIKGYKFSGWFIGERKISDDAKYTFSMPAENYSLTAHFELDKFKLSLSSENVKMGTVSEGGMILYKSPVTVSASPTNAGFSFVGWYAGETLVSDKSNYAFIMPSQDHSLIAKFKRNEFRLDVSSNDNEMGTVSEGGNILYEKSTTVTAYPIKGYKFSGWFNDGKKVSDDVSYTFPMPANNYSLIAHFELDSFNLTLSSENTKMGTVSESGMILYKSPVTITATPSCPGYSFTGWYSGDKKISDSASYRFNMPSNDYSLSAKFTTNTYSLDVNTVDTVMGTVSEDATVEYDKSVTITATPSDGYSFLYWTVNGKQVSTDLSYTFKMPYSNVNAIAVFKINTYEIQVTTESEHKGSVTGTLNGDITFKDTVELNAVPNTGYDFDAWYEGTDIVSVNSSYSFPMPSRSVTLIAHFKNKKYFITYDYNGTTINNLAAGKEVTFDKPYDELEVPTRLGFCFLNWYDDEISNDGTGNIIESTKLMTTASNHTLYAKWYNNTTKIDQILAQANTIILTTENDFKLTKPLSLSYENSVTFINAMELAINSINQKIIDISNLRNKAYNSTELVEVHDLESEVASLFVEIQTLNNDYYANKDLALIEKYVADGQLTIESMKALKVDMTDIKRELEVLYTETGLDSTLDKVKRIAEYIEKTDTCIRDAESAENLIRTDVSKLKTISSLSEEVTKLKVKCDELKNEAISEKTNLQTEIEQIKQEIQQLKSERVITSTSLNTLSGNEYTSTLNYDTLVTTYEEKLVELQESQDLLQTVTSNLKNAKDLKEEKELTLLTLNTIVLNNQGNIDQLNTRTNSLRESTSEMTAERYLYYDAVQKIGSEIAKRLDVNDNEKALVLAVSDSSIGTTQRQISNVTDKIENYQTDMEHINDSITEVETILSEYSTIIANEQNENIVLQDKINSLSMATNNTQMNANELQEASKTSNYRGILIAEGLLTSLILLLFAYFKTRK